jgi:outer membrane protein OmpA-like peptidoglycan-associated protein/tetratricopeptide (TPR) repeat protein
MRKIGIILTVVFIAFAGVLKGQEIEVQISKDDFANKDDYKVAKDNLKQAEEFYALGRGGLRRALDFYLPIVQKLPNNAVLNYKIGICYLKSIQRVRCIDYFKKAYSVNPNVAPDIMWVLASGYHLNIEFDKAIELYNKYKNSLAPSELQEKRKEIDKRVVECNVGKDLVKNPIRVFIDNVGQSINSIYPEYSPLISADESMMMFTSRREDTYGEGRDPEDNLFFEDIYISYNDGNSWGKAKNVGKPLNTTNNDATVGLSPDGQQLFTFNGKTNNGDIFVSSLEGSEWTSPSDASLKKFINTDYHETSASFSFDGRTMYFISDRPDGFGAHDLWETHWDAEKERWAEPKNMGSNINTEYDEEGVFMHPDGRTLYFSSRGHNTMGGFDIFKTTLGDDGTWSKPENLGYPVNTPDDDLFFIMNASGKHGYYSSSRDDGQGDYDIYMITFRGPEKTPVLQNEDNLLANVEPVAESIIAEQVEIKTTRLTILKGTIKDALTLNPVEAQIEIVDNVKNEVISISSSNSSTGRYLISLPSGRNYGIAVKSTGYLFHSENFDIPAATNYQEITKDILLNKMAVGQKVILKNIFFDYAKATLRSESFPELDRLVKMLTDFPNIRIEISGHTDNQGSLQTNQKLSENRAKAVVDYLITKGIAQSRLEFKGYAYLQPIASNDKEDGRQQNRRVEFKVLQN